MTGLDALMLTTASFGGLFWMTARPVALWIDYALRASAWIATCTSVVHLWRIVQ